MANTYNDLENAILERLAPLIDQGVEVEAMPETDADYTEPFENPRVSISFQHSEFSDSIVRGIPESLALGVVANDEFAEIHILLRSRTIRTNDEIKGVYWLHEQVSRLLYGFQPDTWGRLFPKVFDYVGHNNGIWIYDLVLVCRRIALQQFTDDHAEEYPLLEEVFFNPNLRADGITNVELLETGITAEDGRALNIID